MVATGAVSFRVSLREVPAVILVFWWLLGSLEFGLMISSDVPGLLVGGPVTRLTTVTRDVGSPVDHVVPPYAPSLSSPVVVVTDS